jgi:microcystin-dependent protein
MPGGGGTPFIGQIMMVGFNFPPQGWASCDGQLLPISENEALFVLIGTTYGGDGVQTFGLPDLRGRVPIHQGTNAGSVWTIGEVRGLETVTLTQNQMAAHNHSFGLAASSSELTTDRPDNSYPALGGYYAAASTSGTTMGAPTIASAGGSQPHNNMQPYLGINFIISLFGVFPSQN